MAAYAANMDTKVHCAVKLVYNFQYQDQHVAVPQSSQCFRCLAMGLVGLPNWPNQGVNFGDIIPPAASPIGYNGTLSTSIQSARRRIARGLYSQVSPRWAFQW